MHFLGVFGVKKHQQTTVLQIISHPTRCAPTVVIKWRYRCAPMNGRKYMGFPGVISPL